MADSAIGVGAGGSGGGGGGGIAFNTPRDIFNGATRAAAEALRDSTITDTTPFDDDPILGIILTWPVVVTDTIYQVRRGGQWVDVDVLVEGDDGSTGPIGPQSRIVLYAYINTAVAPTVAPAGGTFVLSTGVKTVPAGYTVAPVTPPSGQKTYRPEAIVNPAVDSGTVNLVWSIPAELPAYAAATLAEGSADDAAASAAEAAGSAALVTSYSGAVAILDAVAFESNNIDLTVVGWRNYDFLQFVPRDGDATTQFSRPSTLMPTADLDTVGASRVPINNNDELRVARTAASDVISINITGWTGHPAAGDVITIYGIRSGVEGGRPGNGGGEDPVAALGWQDEGIDLAAVTSVNLVGVGVVGTVTNGVLTITVGSSGGGGTITDDIYWGTSADETPLGSELTIAATAGAAEIPAYVGDMHVLVARLATEADFTHIVRSDDVSQTNQFGGFTKFSSTVVPTGESDAFNVWVSNQALSQSAAVTWTAS